MFSCAVRLINQVVTRIFIVCSAAYFLFIGSVFAAAEIYPHLRLQMFDISHSLVNTNINGVYQDRDGYLWLRTMSALHRYDGHTVRVWRSEAGNENSIPSTAIEQMVEDSGKNLWITSNKEVAWLSPDRSRVQKVKTPNDNMLSDRRLVLGETRHVFLADRFGVYQLDERYQQFTLIFSLPSSAVGMAAQSIVFERDNEGRLWYGNHQTLWLLTFQQEKWNARVVHTFTDSNSFETAASDSDGALCVARAAQISCHSDDGALKWVTSTGASQCQQLLFDHSHRLYARCNGELYHQLDPSTARMQRNDATNPMSGKKFSTMSLDKNGILWLARRDDLVLLDTESQRTRILTLPNLESVMPITQVSRKLSFHEDRQGGMWISSHLGGLMRASLTHTPFVHWRLPSKNNELKTSQMIRALYQETQRLGNPLWVATYDSSVWRITSDKYGTIRDVKSFELKSSEGPVAVDREANAFIRDKQGVLWFGTVGGLWQFDENRQVFKAIKVDWNEAPFSPNTTPAVMGFVQRDNGELWMYGNFGLAELISSKENLVSVRWRKLPEPVTEVIKRNSSDRLFQRLWVGSDGYWWLPGKIGVTRFHPETGAFEIWSKDNSALKCEWVHAVWEQPIGRFWLGTRGCGLQRIDWLPDTQSDARYQWQASIDLPDNTIYGIAKDPLDHLWLSSNRGLFRVDEDGKLVNHFTVEDGLQHNEFNNGQALVGTYGEMYFGGINGISRVDARLLTGNPFPPFVHVTEIETVGNVRQSLTTSLITLPHNLASLTLHYVGLNFDTPERNRFRYRLLGTNEQWVEAAFARSAHFPALLPGRYRFEVQAANRYGVWSTQSASIDIVVTPPWWQSNVAYFVYLMAFILSLVSYTRWRDAREQKLQALVEARTHDLHIALAARERLMAHVSHEFRTPLTLILTPLDRLLMEERSDTSWDALRTMRQNATRLLQLVEQLLQVVRVETLVSDDRSEFCLAEVVHRECAAFSFQSVYSGITLRLDLQTSCTVHISPATVSTLIYNLVGNAFKFCRTGDIITVSVYAEDDGVYLTVHDTGPGIPPELQERVFLPFERGDPISKSGTGLGLYLVRELVRAENAQLSLDSQSGGGTRFSIRFPQCGQTAKAANEHSHILLSDNLKNSTPIVSDLPKASSLKRLLIVEDSLALQQQLILLFSAHYECLVAATSAKAWQIAQEESPDLILCDVGLPDESGFALCNRLKHDINTCHIPLFFLTAYAEQHYRLNGLQSKADDYVVKPFNSEELKLRIANCLAARARLQHWWSQQSSKGDWQSALVQIEQSDQALAKAARQFVKDLEVVLAKKYADRNFGVEQMAEAMAKSTRTLQRQFQEYGLGVSPIEYLRHYRLNIARTMLSQGALIQDAIEACGLDPKRFSMQFKERFGVLPKQWKAEHCQNSCIQ